MPEYDVALHATPLALSAFWRVADLIVAFGGVKDDDSGVETSARDEQLFRVTIASSVETSAHDEQLFIVTIA